MVIATWRLLSMHDTQHRLLAVKYKICVVLDCMSGYTAEKYLLLMRGTLWRRRLKTVVVEAAS
jgi:hypothetical protein